MLFDLYGNLKMGLCVILGIIFGSGELEILICVFISGFCALGFQVISARFLLVT